MSMRRGTRLLVYSMVIFTLLLASCSSGGGSQSTGTPAVPATGSTATTGAGAGAAQPTSTTAAGGAAGQPTATTAAGGAAQATSTTSAGGAAGQPTATTAAGGAAGQPTATTAAGGAAQATSTTAAGGAGQPTATTAAGGAAAGGASAQTTPWKGKQIGGTVSVLAVWGGDELKNFQSMIKPFEDQTGIKVQYEGTRDIGNVLNTRISGGNPPDLAGLPNPGQLTELAKAGSLKPLNKVLDMNMMNQDYDPNFIKLASYNNQLYGIWTKAAVKSLVWYNVKAFKAKGYTAPKSYQELQALEQKIIADGATPWCIGIDGGGGSGWPGTDWVEDIMLHQQGPDVYDQWVTHQIPWTDPKVKQAWQTWGQFLDPKMAYGGANYIISTNFGTAFSPMFQNPPKCYMYKQADFITTFFKQQFPNLQAGTDFDFFQFPGIDPKYDGWLEVGGDLFGMFNDTPQAEALIQYMVTPDAQSIWASKGGFTSANKTVDPKVYPDAISQHVAQVLTQAKGTRFDASDLMPQGEGNAFTSLILQFPQQPNNLDSILQQIEAQSGQQK